MQVFGVGMDTKNDLKPFLVVIVGNSIAIGHKLVKVSGFVVSEGYDEMPDLSPFCFIPDVLVVSSIGPVDKDKI